jgi:hypothetical protein
MYGNGGTIYLIPDGSTINDSRLKVSSNEVMMSFKKDNVRKSAAFYLTDEVFELNFSKKFTRKSLYVSNNTFKVDLFSTGNDKRGVLYMTGNTFKITFKESKTNGEFYLTENVLRVDMEPDN